MTSRSSGEVKSFYLTFGQKYPWRNGWVLVRAPDMETAREWVVQIFGDRWAFLYPEEKFDKGHFPAGQIGETISEHS